MNVDFDHSINQHTVLGPAAIFPFLFGEQVPVSLLDVGCGVGTWLKTALEHGVAEIQGVDGVAIPPENLLFPPRYFRQTDLTQKVDLGRRYDAVLCLEVGEHLEERYAAVLIDTLTRHADLIIFSAACPFQPGQNHFNCQWPVYWQTLFNERQYACSDEMRWRFWNDNRIEPWYRQNLFVAKKNALLAGEEERIRSVVHPTTYMGAIHESSALSFPEHVRQIERGRMPLAWYLWAGIGALVRKVRRRWP